MHLVRKEFAMAREEGIAFAASRGFGLLVTNDDGVPKGSHLPFVIRNEGDRSIVSAHVTAANPLAQLADGRPFLMAVIGDDSYISNDWYATPDQVSTWLYESVHLGGAAHAKRIDDNRRHGDSLLDVCEARLAPKKPWALATMEAEKRESMLSRIRVIEFEIDTVDCQRKLNQFKPDVDHVAVVNALLATGDETRIRLARKMQALRPHLDYGH